MGNCLSNCMGAEGVQGAIGKPPGRARRHEKLHFPSMQLKSYMDTLKEAG